MVVLIVMGVCGTGKTTIGELLSAKLQWPFQDGDTYHSPSNIAKMSQNIPLTDEDRKPWLESLHDVINNWVKNERNGIIGCSALKESYRDILVNNIGYKPLGHCVLILLKGSKDVIVDRMKEREHFMPISLVESQIDTLELPTSRETCIVCDIQLTVDQTVSYVLQEIELFL